MELHPREWGGTNRVKIVAAGVALLLGGAVRGAVLLSNGRKKTPPQRGGWSELSLDDFESE